MKSGNLIFFTNDKKRVKLAEISGAPISTRCQIHELIRQLGPFLTFFKISLLSICHLLSHSGFFLLPNLQKSSREVIDLYLARWKEVVSVHLDRLIRSSYCFHLSIFPEVWKISTLQSHLCSCSNNPTWPITTKYFSVFLAQNPPTKVFKSRKKDYSHILRF